MCEYNDRLLAVAWWVILNSPDLLFFKIKLICMIKSPNVYELPINYMSHELITHFNA